MHKISGQMTMGDEPIFNEKTALGISIAESGVYIYVYINGDIVSILQNSFLTESGTSAYSFDCRGCIVCTLIIHYHFCGLKEGHGQGLK